MKFTKLLRGIASDAARSIYRSLPVSQTWKTRGKSMLFRGLSPVFRHTEAFRAWELFGGQRAGPQLAVRNTISDRHTQMPFGTSGLAGTSEVGKRIVCVSHDACLAGAQLLILNIARTLRDRFGYSVELVVMGPGPLLEEYRKVARVHAFFEPELTELQKHALLDGWRIEGVHWAICNTSVTGSVAKLLVQTGFRVVHLIHELPMIIREYGLEESVRLIAAHSQVVVFPAALVRDEFRRLTGLDAGRCRVRPQGLYRRNPHKHCIVDARAALRAEFGWPADTPVVLGAGFGDWRKGIDLFADVALRTCNAVPNAKFLWIGGCDEQLGADAIERVDGATSECPLIFAGPRHDPSIYFAGADVYLLTSREDPFPSVVMEAMEVGVPVVGFEGAGGFCDLLREGAGRLVSYLDCPAMVGEVTSLLRDPASRARVGQTARDRIADGFAFEDYVSDLLTLFQRPNAEHQPRTAESCGVDAAAGRIITPSQST